MKPVYLIFILLNIVTTFFLTAFNNTFFYASIVSFGITFPLFFCLIRQSNYGLLKIDIFQPSVPLIAVFYWFYLSPFLYGSLKLDNLLYQENFIVLIYCIIGLLFFSFGYNLKINIKASPNNNKTNFFKLDLFKNKLVIILFSLSVIYIIIFFNLVVGFDFTAILLRLSPSVRSYIDISFNTWFFIIVNFFNCTLYMYMFVLIYNDKNLGALRANTLIKIILIALIGITVSYIIEAKRSVVLPYFLLPLIWFHYFISPFKNIFKILTIFIIFFLLTYASLVIRIGAWHKGYAGYFMLSQETEMANFIKEPDTKTVTAYKMYLDDKVFADSYLKSKNNNKLLFYKYNIEHILLSIIPRFIWTNKPLYPEHPGVYFHKAIQNTDSTKVAMAITTFLTPLILFGKFFGALYFFIYGFFCRYIYNYFRSENSWKKNLFYPVVLWVMFEYNYHGIVGPTWIYAVQNFLPFLILYFLLKKEKKLDV